MAPRFWEGILVLNPDRTIVAMTDDDGEHGIGDGYPDEVKAAFADVDSKSPFATGHSRGVACFTD